MRLLECSDNGTFKLTKDLVHNIPSYAILSHTWSPDTEDEVSFKDLVDGTGSRKVGYEKIRFCAERARHDGLKYFWVDTCCIDKSNSSELSTAINSMFRWYQNAARCYVYLSGILATSDQQLDLACESALRAHRWFTRGWTLQELLAPASVEFFTQDGHRLGDKRSLEQQIHEITGITALALRETDLSQFDVEERFRWAETRQTTHEEDWAYCLLGIFGIFMPLIYGEGKVNAVRRFKKEIADAMSGDDKSPQQSKHAAKRIIPFPRNEDVVDRGIFAVLEQLLSPSHHYQSAALWGLGGSGKTQVALEYAYRRSLDPACSVFWVHADNETTFAQDYKLVARKLGLPSGLDGTELLTAVRDRIEADSCWLLILDNADDLELFGMGRTQQDGDHGQGAEEKHSLYEFIPRGPGGAVLWTSRDKRISGTLVGARRAINVAGMTEGEARDLLEAVRGREISEEESQDATALLAELEKLPLAVSQAAAYLRRTATPIRRYLSMLHGRSKRWEVLQKTAFDRHRRQHVSNSVLETWDISIQHVQRENELAYNILCSLAFVENQNIPFELIVKVAETMNEEARRTTSRSDEDGSWEGESNNCILAAITLLQEFSFLRSRASDGGSQAYEMHKLVQEATEYSLSNKDRQENKMHFSEVAFRAMINLFPEPRRELWAECERYLAHAQCAAEWAVLWDGEVEAATLLTRTSDYLFDRGRWREKEPVDQRAYDFRKKVFGEKHPDTIWSMASLAATYHQQGRYEEAEKIKVDVLALQRDVLGEKHPDTLESMANLAVTYHEQGRYEEAEKIKVDVLALRRDMLSEKHPDTIWSMASLASTYHQQGRHEEAEKIDIEVLALRRDVLGEKHPDTIWSMANLASTYHEQGRYEEAEKIEVDVLALRRELLGEKHPDTIWSMASLASTYHEQGRYEEVEKIDIEVLALRRDVLGEKHPDTIWSMANLASTYHEQGRYEEAEKIEVDVLALGRELLGEKHPDTLWAMYSLAITWNRQQRFSGAMAMMEECLHLQREVLGLEHPHTQRSLNWLNSWKATTRTKPIDRIARKIIGRPVTKLALLFKARIS